MKHKQGGERTPAAKSAVNNKKPLFAFLLLSFSIFLAYSNSINGTWAMDDIVAYRPVGINDIFDIINFRKVTYLTFLLNKSLAPFSPANFRIFNILLHITNSLLIYLLAYRTVILTFGNSGYHPKKHKKDEGRDSIPENRAFAVALFSSVVFGLHPLNINAVAYIIQRSASLATFFVLLSVLCFIYASQREKRLQSIFLYACSAASLVAGILSKENAVVGIPLILLYDYFFLSGFNIREFGKRALAVVGAGIICIGLTSYFFKFHNTIIDISKLVFNLNEPLAWKGWMATDVYWTPFQHILTEFRVVSRYLFLVVVPLPRFLIFDWWGFPVSLGLIEPLTTLLSVLFLSALLLFSTTMRKRYPFLCFGVLWYLIAISLESFVALGSDLYFEHRNYLPVAGLFTGIFGQIVVSLIPEGKSKTVWVTAAILSILFGSLTFSRNFAWKDSITLWTDTIKKSPSNIRAMMSSGNAFLMAGDFKNATTFYKEAVSLSIRDKRPTFLNDSVYRLGMAYLSERNLAEAKKLIDAAETRIDSYNLKILRAFYKALHEDIDGAIKDYNEILPETGIGDRTIVLTLTGDALRQKGLWDAAIENYKNALVLNQGFAAAYYGMGMAYLGKRDIELATASIDKALLLEPDHVLALSDKADLMLIKKLNPLDALIYAQRAISHSPPFYQPYVAMGNVLIVLDREKEAEDFYKKALEHGMPDYLVPFSKARAYYIKGNSEEVNYYLSELKKYKDLPATMQGIAKSK